MMKLIQRYRMSFAKGNVPDPRKTEVAPLPSCTNCAYQSETTVCVYFLSSKINTIITSIHKPIIIFSRTLWYESEALWVPLSCWGINSNAVNAKDYLGPKAAVHFRLLDFFQKFESLSPVSCGSMAGVLNWMNTKDVSCKMMIIDYEAYIWTI
jgi:hypothetical protein